MKNLVLVLSFIFICLPAMANEYTNVTFTTADGDKEICSIGSPGDFKVFATGTWGSGVLSIYETTDNGTTKIAVHDLTGVATTLSADGSTNTINVFTNKNKEKTKRVWGTLSGSTGATLSVYCEDNRG
jgi:hypothetical protein